MRNGIKKYVIASIPIIFGCLFGFSYTNASTAWVNVPVGWEQIIDNSWIWIAPDNNWNFNWYSSDILKNVIFWKNSTKFAFYYYTPDGIWYYNNAGWTPTTNNSRYWLVERYQITWYNNYLTYNSNNFWYATWNTREEVQALWLKQWDITDIAYVYPTNSTDRWFYNFGACLRSENKDVSICFWCSSSNSNCQINTWADNIITYDNSSIAWFESIPDTYLNNSPFAWWWWETTPIIYTGTITNQHAIYAYEQLWITPQQCYWWYPIDTIYNTGNILYQWYQAWTGASIIDLYNLYSWNYNWYQSTYMTEEQTKISQFLSEIYQWYENNGTSFFIWKPEAIITIIQQYNNANQKAIEKGRWYSLFQLYTYCDLLINHNNNEEYTGNTATPDMRRNGIDTENQEIVLPATWSVFDELQQDWEFKRNKAQDIRDTINSVYTKLTKIFNLRWWVQGIIPDYITRILLLIILFAIFKK